MALRRADAARSTIASRTTLGVVLMASQAFVYNAIFFTYALILTSFYNVPADKVGLYILPFAIGNFLGPLLLGPLVRHAGAAADDHRHLRDLGRAAGGDGLDVPCRPSRRHDADGDVERGLLLRLGGGECGLSHRGRDASRWRSAR